MKKTIMTTCLIVMLICLSEDCKADFRCNHDKEIIRDGVHRTVLEKYCRKPDLVKFTFLGHHLHEVWYYDLGPRTFVTWIYIRVKTGYITRVEEGDYGTGNGKCVDNFCQ